MKKLFALAALALAIPFSARAAEPTVNLNGWYAGPTVTANMSGANADVFGAGLEAGYQWNRFLRTELDVNHARVSNGYANSAMGQVIGQYRIPSTALTPYVFVGTGLGFGNLTNNNDHAFQYDLGVGTRIALTQNIDLDVRYSNVRSLTADAGTKPANVVTIGVLYNF